MNNPYTTLGLTKEASADDIKKAYRKLAMQYHPDRNPGDSEAEAKFKEVQAAYDILSDQSQRNSYDQHGTINPTGSPFGKGKPFTSVFDDFFNDFFAQRKRERQRGEDIVVEIPVTIQQVYSGGEVEVKYVRRNLCDKCKGRGGEDGICPHCNGSGLRIIHGQAMSVQTTCHGCGGTGRTIAKSCDGCEGGYASETEELLTFQIPPGVENGMRFVRKGMGEPCPASEGPPGNLYIVVKVGIDLFFERMANGHISVKIPVSYTQLVLGATVDVPTISGGVVAVKIPAGSQPGAKFRLNGLGLPIFNNSNDIYKHGDQLVQVVLEVPTNIDGRHRELLEQLIEFDKSQLSPMKTEYLERLERSNGRTQK